MLCEEVHFGVEHTRSLAKKSKISASKYVFIISIWFSWGRTSCTLFPSSTLTHARFHCLCEKFSVEKLVWTHFPAHVCGCMHGGSTQTQSSTQIDCARINRIRWTRAQVLICWMRMRAVEWGVVDDYWSMVSSHLIKFKYHFDSSGIAFGTQCTIHTTNVCFEIGRFFGRSRYGVGRRWREPVVSRKSESEDENQRPWKRHQPLFVIFMAN